MLPAKHPDFVLQWKGEQVGVVSSSVDSLLQFQVPNKYNGTFIREARQNKPPSPHIRDDLVTDTEHSTERYPIIFVWARSWTV
jgi:hypothetical protein